MFSYDYYVMIEELPFIQFMLLAERKQTSQSMIAAISKNAFADINDSEKENIMRSIVKNTCIRFDYEYCLTVEME